MVMCYKGQFHIQKYHKQANIRDKQVCPVNFSDTHIQVFKRNLGGRRHNQFNLTTVSKKI